MEALGTLLKDKLDAGREKKRVVIISGWIVFDCFTSKEILFQLLQMVSYLVS